MCIIVYKPKGVKLPPIDILDTCWYSNPDGAGIMWQEGGTVKWIKGLMTIGEFYTALPWDKDDVDMVLHFRIATAGGVCKEMTHPFPYVNNYDKMGEVEGECRTVVAHNGILSIPEEYGDVSDTATMVKYLATSGVKIHRPNTHTLIEAILDGTNKLAVLRPTETILLGSGWIKDSGIYYSNKGYESYGNFRILG